PADLPPDPFRQAVPGELLPAVTAVARHVQTAARTAAGHLPRAPARLPQAGEQDVRVRGVETDVRGPRVRVLLEHLLPGLSSVPGAVHAAFGIGTEGVAEDRREGDVRVLRVDDHRPDLSLLFPDVRPGLPPGGRLVDAVSCGGVA